jgi:ferredoxin-NADP reductase
MSVTHTIADAIPVRIGARRTVARNIDEFILVATTGEPLPAWSAGAHIDVATPGGPVRQYSLCPCTAAPGAYRILVERRPDSRGGSESAHGELPVGAQTWISRPRNHFALTRALEYVFIAGGVGITPLLSLIEQACRLGRPWRLIYLGRTRAQMASADELVEQYGDRVTIHESGRSGRLDLAHQLSEAGRGTAVYVCGPPGMVDAVARACAPRTAVDWFAERFTVAEQSGAPNEEFEVSLAFSSRTVTIPAHRTILEVLDEQGVVVPASCREGMCGTCETGVVSGEVEHRDAILSPEERSENESMMICVSRCTSGRLVLEL